MSGATAERGSAKLETELGSTELEAELGSTKPELDNVELRDRLLMGLTFSSGAVDAICYLALGKVFTAFMTGNFVFLGLRIAGAAGPNIVSVAVSLVVFSAGVFLATRIVKASRGSAVWPRRVTLALGVALVAHAGFLGVWMAVDGRPSLGDADVLLGISALAMGVQTGAVYALGVAGVFTTAATATTTVLMGDSASWARTAPKRRRLAGMLAALVAGAIAGGLLIVHARSYAPLIPLLATTVVLTIAATALRTRVAGDEHEPH
jgi:uncharacterized membrane protein YoaK (UPF0700 family)